MHEAPSHVTPSAHAHRASELLRFAEAVVRLLHLNPPQNSLRQSGDDEHYKVLVLDTFTKAVIAPLLRVNELRCLPAATNAESKHLPLLQLTGDVAQACICMCSLRHIRLCAKSTAYMCVSTRNQQMNATDHCIMLETIDRYVY